MLLGSWAATALLVAACGDGRRDSATTTAPSAPRPGLDQPVLVTNADGVFQIGTDGTITGLLDIGVAVAVDDTQGGLLYQVESGRGAPRDDRSTIVWWTPERAGGAQELLVPAPSSGHVLTLHDTYPTASGFAVLYTRHETDHPVDAVVDSLRRFEVPDRRVTELYSQGAFEQGYLEVSTGGQLISGTSFDQVSSRCFIDDLDGRPTDLVPLAANDPTREEHVTGCTLSPDGSRLAFAIEDTEWTTVHLWRLGDTEEARFVVPASAGHAAGIDLSDRTLLLNLERGGPLPALVFDLDAPDASPRPLPVTGVARFAMEPVDVDSPAGPSTTSSVPASPTTPTSMSTAPTARCSAADVPMPPAQEDLPGRVADLRSEILLAATACDFDRLNELALAGDGPFIHTDVLADEYQNMAPGEFWRELESQGVGLLAGLVHDLSQPVELAESDRLGVLYEWRDPALCGHLDDVQLCRWVIITEAGDWIAFYSESA